MSNGLANPSFTIYAISALVLCANLLFLWGYSGATRAKTKTAINEEDAAKFGASLAPTDPPAVARVLGAHSNVRPVSIRLCVGIDLRTRRWRHDQCRHFFRGLYRCAPSSLGGVSESNATVAQHSFCHRRHHHDRVDGQHCLAVDSGCVAARQWAARLLRRSALRLLESRFHLRPRIADTGNGSFHRLLRDAVFLRQILDFVVLHYGHLGSVLRATFALVVCHAGLLVG